MLDVAFKQALEDSRLSVFDVRILQSFQNNSNLQGRLAEQMVRQWLENSAFEFEQTLPRRVDDLTFIFQNYGVEAIRGNQKICEFDFMGQFQGRNYVIEVKSQKMNGFFKTIHERLKYAKLFYNDDVDLIVFAPLKNKTKNPLTDIRLHYPLIHFVDTQYSKYELHHSLDVIHDLYEGQLFLEKAS